jgi:hypothetical protein
MDVRMLLLAKLHETVLKPHELGLHVLVLLRSGKIVVVEVLRMIVVLEPRQCPMICDSASGDRTGARARTGAGTATPKGRQGRINVCLLSPTEGSLKGLEPLGDVPRGPIAPLQRNPSSDCYCHAGTGLRPTTSVPSI